MTKHMVEISRKSTLIIVPQCPSKILSTALHQVTCQNKGKINANHSYTHFVSVIEATYGAYLQ